MFGGYRFHRSSLRKRLFPTPMYVRETLRHYRLTELRHPTGKPSALTDTIGTTIDSSPYGWGLNIYKKTTI